MRAPIRVSTLVIALLTIASCTGGGAHPSPSPSRSPSATPSGAPETPSFPPPQGGEAVFGAEQWPECVNPITACAAFDWTWYTVLEHVLPRAMQLDVRGNFVASPLLVEAPTLENGGVTEDPFTVRYRISEAAVWEDGTPITSTDFRFTWRALVSTKNAFRTAGYDLIEDIDATDPRVAIIRFSEAYAPWPDLFGGPTGFVLKAAAFPNKARQEDPDLSERMMDNMPFSGGPWILRSWTRDGAVLVRNDRYFGPKAILDQVTMLPRTDQSTELQSILTGEVQAIYPFASDVSLLDHTELTDSIGGEGQWMETVMFNLQAPHLDDLLVRQAVLFALDRQAVVDELAKLNNPVAEVLNCGFVALPHLGQSCRTQPFAQYAYNPERSRALLEQAGYDCSSTPCRKGGKPLRILYTTIGTNSLRLSIEDILTASALDAGIELRVKNFEASILFGDAKCPYGTFSEVSQCAQLASADPSVTALFACDQIPTPADFYAGRNWTGWCNPEADQLMHEADRELDPSRRADLLDRVYELEAEDAIGIPLFVRPAVSIWRPDQIAGPVGLWNGTSYGLFFNMDEWYLVTS
jgi:peptide/nickel transport system substrate-binding protein